MLTITPTAAGVLDKTRFERGASTSARVRFFTTRHEADGGARLAFAFVDTPQDGDTILTEAPIDACVAPEVEEMIGDVTVDTKDDDDGLGLVVKRA